MGRAKIKLWNRIEIKGDFDTYGIEQDENRFITTSENGYDNSDGGGHRSLVVAIQHVTAMIKTEYIDRCLEEPKK
jgi:hypothetical protein